MTKAVIATANEGKFAEIKRMLDGLPLGLVSMTTMGLDSPEETGTTFSENAVLKARYVAFQTGHLAIADDSGLEVDVLLGAPGVYSARYAGQDADDEANNAKLLKALEGVSPDARTARFVCCAAVVQPDGTTRASRGTLEGSILEVPRGTGGFGYDPLFVADGHTKSNAELEAEEKDAISHRGRAFRALRVVLEQMLKAR